MIYPSVAEGLIAQRALAAPPWRYTDDTQMALSIVSVLSQHEFIHQAALADSFARNYEPSRNYGPAMHGLLKEVGAGADWEAGARAQFEGQGSFGNGAAMRVAPVGAFFAEDLPAVVEHAAHSAVVTHAHPEGVAGAICSRRSGGSCLASAVCG